MLMVIHTMWSNLLEWVLDEVCFHIGGKSRIITQIYPVIPELTGFDIRHALATRRKTDDSPQGEGLGTDSGRNG